MLRQCHHILVHVAVPSTLLQRWHSIGQQSTVRRLQLSSRSSPRMQQLDQLPILPGQLLEVAGGATPDFGEGCLISMSSPRSTRQICSPLELPSQSQQLHSWFAATIGKALGAFTYQVILSSLVVQCREPQADNSNRGQAMPRYGRISPSQHRCSPTRYPLPRRSPTSPPQHTRSSRFSRPRQS